MKLTKLVLLLSTLTFGVSNAAGTAPCNGFKINLKNHTQQKLVVDSVLLSNGTMNTLDSQLINVNDAALYTVNGTLENNTMTGEFLAHTAEEPLRDLRINFNLTNQNVLCEVGNTSQKGSLHTSFDRVLGGLTLVVKD